MSADNRLKVLLDRIREQSYDPQLYAALEKAIQDSIAAAYLRGKNETLSRVQNPDTTGK